MPDSSFSSRDNVILREKSDLTASRLCHDLISPLGAISNGLELLLMSGPTQSEELTLIQDSIRSANSKIRFFRIALGASNSAQAMANQDIQKILNGNYASERVSVSWDAARETLRYEAKIAFLATMCVESALPLGGSIDIQNDRGGWRIRGIGPRIKFEREQWDVLSNGDASELTAGSIQFGLLAAAFAKTGQTAQVGHSDSAISIIF